MPLAHRKTSPGKGPGLAKKREVQVPDLPPQNLGQIWGNGRTQQRTSDNELFNTDPVLGLDVPVSHVILLHFETCTSHQNYPLFSMAYISMMSHVTNLGQLGAMRNSLPYEKTGRGRFFFALISVKSGVQCSRCSQPQAILRMPAGVFAVLLASPSTWARSTVTWCRSRRTAFHGRAMNSDGRMPHRPKASTV